MPFADPILSKELVTIWADCVFNAPEVTDFTKHFHPCDKTEDQDSTCDLSTIMHCGEINFVQYFIQRFRTEDQVGRCGGVYRYRVRVEYYLEDTCNNQNKIQEFFELLDDEVERLNAAKKDCVPYFFGDDTFPDIRFFGRIENKAVYVGSYTYFAETTRTS